MTQAYICDAIRTPFGRYGGALSGIRTDDLGALPLKALMARNPSVDWEAVTDVLYGCVNQAGEDNRNVAHMASLLAGLPYQLPGATINRLCGSGLDAVGTLRDYRSQAERLRDQELERAVKSLRSGADPEEVLMQFGSWKWRKFEGCHRATASARGGAGRDISTS